MEQSDRYTIRLIDGREFGPAEMDVIRQWAGQGRVPRDAMLISEANGEARSVLSDPAMQTILQAPPTVSGGMVAPPSAPMLVPYKNPAALAGYYLSVFSLIPILGILMGIPAIILGIIGLRRRAERPEIHGMAHGIVAIVLGGLTTLVYGAIVIAIIVQ